MSTRPLQNVYNTKETTAMRDDRLVPLSTTRAGCSPIAVTLLNNTAYILPCYYHFHMYQRRSSSNCYKCGARLTAEDKAGAYGSTHTICRKCHNRASMIWSKRHIEERDAYAARWRRDNPRYMKKYYKKNKGRWEEYNKKEAEEEQ